MKHGLGASWSEFRAYLANVRKQGFYWSKGELEQCVSAAAVPILGADGEALAALALVGTVAALEHVGESRLRTQLAGARDEIQTRLGAAADSARETRPEESSQAPSTITAAAASRRRRAALETGAA